MKPPRLPGPAPQWLIDACGVPSYTQPPAKQRITHAPPVEVNRDAAYKQGLHYVLREAPMADEGERNATAYKVAARLKDLGLDEPDTLELTDQWTELHCDPPMTRDEVAHVVRSAYSYTRSPQGSASPEADFTPIGADDTRTETDGIDAQLDPKPTRAPFTPIAIEDDEPHDIPPREWLIGDFALSGKVTELIAPPGAGKSTFSLQVAMAVATGQDYAGMAVKRTGNVLMINNEDDLDELKRRRSAVRQYYSIPYEDIEGKIWMHSGVERPFLIAKRKQDGTVKALDKDAVLDFIAQHAIKLLVVDPFLETHTVSENSNEEIAQVARMYREIAVRGNCAVVIVHHTRKLPAGSSDGHVGNMESGRGASSLAGVARVVVTLYSMSKKDAKTYGVSEQDRHLYVRLDGAKANLSLMTYQPRWYRKDDVELPNGDHVGVLAVADLAPVEEATGDAMLDAVQICLANHDGEITLQQAAKAVADALGEDPSKLTTIKRRLQELLARKIAVNGWLMWYADEDRPATKDHGRTRHWIYGHVDHDLDDEPDPFLE